MLVRTASQEGIRILSMKLLTLIQDKGGRVYQDNVAKFGIPDEYVEKAFSEESMVKAAQDRGSTYYLALEGSEILGFAQVNPENQDTVELDRIVVFPEYSRKGIGTSLLREAISDQKRKGVKTVIVNAGKDESHARRFYEKNGFREIRQVTIDAPWGSKLALVTYELQL
jgi:ribosomal protein S18 acetylase RimI-like enzyme